MRALRSVANADDEGFANEDRGLTIADLAVREMGWARHHEQLVAIDVELWQLVCEERILDRQRVQVVILLELAQLRLARLEQSDPDEFGAIGCTADRLIERDRAAPLTIAIETGGDDAHRGRLSEAPRDAAAAHDRGGGNARTGRQHDVPSLVVRSARTLQTAQLGLRRGHKRRRCVWLQHHALRPERIQQEPSARTAEPVGADQLAIKRPRPR